MQYDVYDPLTTESMRASRVASLLPGALEAVRNAAQADRIENADVGPAMISWIDPVVAPYALCKEKPHALVEIAVPDIPTLFGSAIRLGKQEAGRISLGQTAVRTVFGASESTPVRALSYLLPGLHLVEAMRRSGKFSKLPQIQYIAMGETASRMNGLSRDDVRRNVDLLIDLGEAYVDCYYPELKEQVIFVRDDGFLDHPEVVRGREALRENDIMRQHPSFPAVSQALSQLGVDNTYDYAVLHPLVHDAVYEESPFTAINGSVSLIHNPDLLVNIGGQREKVFYKARMMFRDILAKQGYELIPSVQLFSCHRVPPYIPMEEDGDRLRDITLDDVLADPRAFFTFDMALNKNPLENNLMARDYKLLYGDSPTRGFPYFLGDALSDIRNNGQEDTN